MSREEKYRAKISIDTVVQRLGDTLAALAFEILGRWGAVVGRLASMPIPVVALESYLTFDLGGGGGWGAGRDRGWWWRVGCVRVRVCRCIKVQRFSQSLPFIYFLTFAYGVWGSGCMWCM